MTTIVSVRLDEDAQRLIRRLARQRGQSKSALIRDALAALAQRESAAERPAHPYAAMRHLIGCARGGPSDLSQRTGEQFRRLLAERQARRQ